VELFTPSDLIFYHKMFYSLQVTFFTVFKWIAAGRRMDVATLYVGRWAPQPAAHTLTFHKTMFAVLTVVAMGRAKRELLSTYLPERG
jgi:hypothetical protein